MFEDMFLQTFAVAAFVSVDARGEETHAAPASYACRFQPTDRLARDRDGSQVVASGILYTLAEVGPRDFIWPPGATPGDISASRRPISIQTHYDLETGALAFYSITF